MKKMWGDQIWEDINENTCGSGGDFTLSVATTRPSSNYWMRLLFVPLTTLVFTVAGAGLYHVTMAAEVSRYYIFMAWLIVTPLALIWSLVYETENLTWTLTPKDLRLGLDQDDLVITFDEIESIVPGLPRLPLLFRLGHFLPSGYGICHASAIRQNTAFLLRLRDGRSVLLDFTAPSQEDGQTLMKAFLQINEAKIIGRENCVPAEVAKPRMAKARLAAVEDFQAAPENKLPTSGGEIRQNERELMAARATVAI